MQKVQIELGRKLAKTIMESSMLSSYKSRKIMIPIKLMQIKWTAKTFIMEEQLSFLHPV